MTKLIYSGAFDSNVDVGLRLIEDPAVLTKSASTIFGCDYDELMPDKDHVGLHIVALGDFEHYGSNRNGDSFPKKACVDYHSTFEKFANLFRHHRNKDPEKRLGQVVKSAYAEPMARIELFVHAHKDKARDELQKLASDGEIPFSMACRVAYDRCSVCQNLRKSASDPNQCDHVKYSLGRMQDDGKVICTHNDQPKFFDISFVGRPADRIAWNLKTAAGEIVDSVKLAEAEGVWVPDHLVITSHAALTKQGYVNEIARIQWFFDKLANDTPRTSSERYIWELRKSAGARLSDEVIEDLRQFEPADVFVALAKEGAILDPESFFKYAMGADYGELAPYIEGTKAKVAHIFGQLVERGECQRVCNDATFDVDTDRMAPPKALRKLAAEIGKQFSVVGPSVDQRVIENTIRSTNVKIALDTNTKMAFNTCVTIDVLAEKYAAYKVAALQAILDGEEDTEAALAVAAVQNFVEQA
jgi:hypothetical protein